MANLKLFLKNLLVSLLTDLSVRKIKLHNPIVIGITGNVGKTSTKDYIYTVLENNSDVAHVRATEKSYNSEIGIPLTILGESNKWNNYLAWFFLIFRNYFKHFFSKYFYFIYDEKYPKVLVLEVGADGPGNIKDATKIFKPDVVVLTAFADHPVHMEYFKTREDFIREKKCLLDALKEDGTVIYNADDLDMTKMALASNAPNKISYGRNSKDVRLITSTFMYDEESGRSNKLLGSKIIFTHNSLQYNVELSGVVGGSHAYAFLASVCVGLTFDIAMHGVIESMEEMEYPKSRLRIFEGLNNCTVIDDSYNSSPKAAELALDTLRSLISRGKKIAVLGHMAELGDGSDLQHKKIGMMAAESADIVLFVGRHNEWYLEGVRETRFDLDNVYLADNANAAIETVKQSINLREEDIILLKGSQSARIDRVVMSVLKNKEDIVGVCRQEKEWLKR
jgi:UDP-N-acetylmuramoyl-tripeptide--D-alanyl-D-alanine ligase